MDFELGRADGLLICSDSERNQDLFYLTGLRAPDPFVFLWTAREKILLVSDLEIDRARQEATVDRVLAVSHYENELRDKGNKHPSNHQILLAFLRDLGLQALIVPDEFPLATADILRQGGIDLDVAGSPLLPQRQLKRPWEIEAITTTLRATELGMATAVDTIAAATVRDGVLFLDGEELTSERLRRHIHLCLLELDCVAQRTIVAGGVQACDPHQEGYGPLRAGEAIIIDIFPRHARSGYHGDLTRTVVKGTAPDPLRSLYSEVKRANQLALNRIVAGVDGHDIHREILQFFDSAGWETGERDGYMQGFFHGTGHGLGLDIHESPSIGRRRTILQNGHVLTVEPGLYYRSIGGVRLEDVVVVRPDGCENLTQSPMILEIE